MTDITERSDAEVARLLDVMAEYLPILEALESSGHWDCFAKTTGIATANRYRAALQENPMSDTGKEAEVARLREGAQDRGKYVRPKPGAPAGGYSPADDLVDRVARAMCVADGADPDICVYQVSEPPTFSHNTPIWLCKARAWERRLPAAFAAVALVLGEAAGRIEKMPRRVERLGGQRTSYVQLGEVMEELHAMMPEEKPHD